MTTRKRVRIVQDNEAENPRNWDNQVKLYCWHRRYNLGDEHSYDSSDFLQDLACEHDPDLEDYIDRLENDVTYKLYERAGNNGCDTYGECCEYAEKFVRPRINARIEKSLNDGYVILPINMYDHSGIALSTSSFSCPWDSGQVGWAVIDKDTLDREFAGDVGCAEECIRAEIETYSQYIRGDVWGYVAEELVDDEWTETDSCWGFFGSDVETNGMKDNLSDDYHDALEQATIYYA